MKNKNKNKNIEKEVKEKIEPTCECGDENCTCDDTCTCDENCTCGCQDEKCTCGCEDGKCTCDDSCECDENCTCDESCECDENCTCGCEDDKCTCGCEDEDCACEDDKNYKILYLNEQQKSEEYLNLAKRYGADLENYKKRNAEIANKEREEGIILAIEKILPAIDALDRANSLVDDESSLKGLDLIKKQMLSNLETLGVKTIDSKVGLSFDPKLHNAIAMVDDSKQKSGTIVEEYQKGYTLNSRVIRFSIVKVVK